MKRFAIIIACIALALTVGCASNTKIVETLDPATGSVTQRTTTSITDTAKQAESQVAYGKLLAKHGIFEIEAAEKTVTDLVYDAAGKVVGKTSPKPMRRSKSAVPTHCGAYPMPKWTLVTEPGNGPWPRPTAG